MGWTKQSKATPIDADGWGDIEWGSGPWGSPSGTSWTKITKLSISWTKQTKAEE